MKTEPNQSETPRMDAASSEGEMYKIGCELELELAASRQQFKEQVKEKITLELEMVELEKENQRLQEQNFALLEKIVNANELIIKSNEERDQWKSCATAFVEGAIERGHAAFDKLNQNP